MTKVTLQTIKAAAANLAKAEAQQGSSNAARTLATKTLFVAVGGFFHGNPAVTVEAVLPVIYGEAWAGFKPTVQKSRKTEWNTVREVAVRDHGLFGSIAETVGGMEKDFRATMLRAVTYAKNNGSADIAAVKAKLEAKPAKTEANDGDIFEGFMTAGADLFQRFPARFKAVQPQLAALQTYYNAERGAGRLRTSKELQKAKQPEAALDFGSIK